MKRSFQLTVLPALVACAVSAVSASCTKTGNPAGSGNDLQLPKVEITAGEVGETQISFILSPENASDVRYLVAESSEVLPDAASIMSDGEEADPAASKEYVATGLEPSTSYMVLAAARNADGLTSLVSRLEMTTGEHVPVIPSVTLSDVTVDGNSASFAYSLSDAETATWICLPASEPAPDAQGIFSAGEELPADATAPIVIENLLFETEYVVYAAAQNADGYSEVASASFATSEAPVVAPEVGDFYYSDGTWSTSSSSPDPAKTVIGILFRTGAASDDLSDYSKAGIGEVKGFVVSLTNALHLEEAWYGTKEVTSFDWTVKEPTDAGTSQSEDDFSGYYNTLKIKDFAESSYAGLAYDNMPAAYAAVNHEPEGLSEGSPAAPEGTTGWFFPSAGQMKELFSAASAVSSSLEKVQGDSLTGDFWSSSTAAGTPVYSYCIHYDGATVSVEALSQYRVWMVRPMLAF